MVAVDSSASGAQLMSAMTNCIAGAMATGLIDPNKRADLYTETTVEMNSMLHESGISVDVPRADMKQAVMTVLYGSKAEPKKLFGEDTTELTTFYKVLSKVVPGAMFLLQDLLEAWNSYSKVHQWQMPDGFEAVIKVMETKDCRIEIDELAHTQLSYQYKVNEGTKRGLSIAANAIHSVDAMVVRAMHRKCNYDPVMVNAAYEAICTALDMEGAEAKGKVAYYSELYEASKLADVVALPWIVDDATGLSKQHLQALKKLCLDMLQHKPFPIVSIHDAFASTAGNVNWIRYHYKETVADIAASDILSFLFSQLLHKSVTYQKLGDISEQIRNSEYAVC
jgi:hypothetical protein